MDNLFKNNHGEEGVHPARERLLLCVDGELSPKEAAQVQAHLEACWRCRVKTKKIEEGIANIIEFDEAVLKPHLVLPHNWRNFDRRLSQLASETGKRSPLANVFGSLGRFFSTVHLWSMSRPLARVAAGLLVAVLIVTLAIRFNHEPTVTASELLEKATEAQAARLHATAEPVIHQRVQVRRLKSQTSSSEVAVNWEIWNDTKNSRIRYFVAYGGGSSAATDHATARNDRSDNVSGMAVVTELAQVLEANHMDPQRPLSAASYQSWRNTLDHKQDEVTRSKSSGGLDALTLHTIPVGHINVGQIAEAVFVVSARDWLPIELRLSVAAEGGNYSYELTEDTLEVMSLAQINPAIFGGEEIASALAQKTSPQASPTSAPVVKLNTSPRPLLVKPAQPVATADLEVEALQLLNQVGADLGEQVSVKRTGDGILEITGIVEPAPRKAEIINALEPIANNPAVRIEIQTVTEAVAQQQQRSRTKALPPPATEQKVEINSGSMAAESALRSYFNSDEQARQFAARMVSRSRQAMSHLYALKRLAGQFSAEELHTLSPAARDKWLALIRTHARAYQQGVAGLRQELQPIFFPSASAAGVQSDPEITDIYSVMHAIQRLFKLGSANDHVILSAFTTSSEGATVTAIKTGAFWQSLNNAEALAARIQSAK